MRLRNPNFIGVIYILIINFLLLLRQRSGSVFLVDDLVNGYFMWEAWKARKIGEDPCIFLMFASA